MTRRTGASSPSTAALFAFALLYGFPLFAAANQLPIANAGPDRTAAVGSALSFDGSGSYDPDGTVAAYWWQFGDGGAASTTGATVSHTYAAAGTYVLSLWVRDDAGAWSAIYDRASVSIGGSTATTTTTTTTTTLATTTTLGSNIPPIADAGPNQATQTLITLTFDGSSSHDPDGYIALAAWKFGDGTSAPGLSATHSYAKPGTYTASLMVIDNSGTAASATALVSVADRPPVANAGSDVSGAPGVAVTLDGSGSFDPDGTITGWAWAFGDGTTGSGATASHAYAAAGTYTATLTVTDDHGARSSDTAVVAVSDGVTAWSRSVGSTGSDAGYAVGSDAAGNTFVGGVFQGTVNFGGTTLTSLGGSDWFLAKYSPTGTLLWARRMGGTSTDLLDALAVDGNGDVVATGRFSGTASFGGVSFACNGIQDMVVAKYSGMNGAHQWSNRYGGAYDDGASAVGVDGGNNVYFTGYFRGTADFGGGPLHVPYDSDLDVFLVKLSATGTHVWSKNFPNTGNERGYGLAVDATGNVAITGYFSNTIDFGGGALTSANGMTDVFVARFTGTGVHTWSRRFGAPDGNEGAYGAAMDPSGNVIITGYAVKAVDLGGGLLSALGNCDSFVAKYAATSGAHLWSRRLGGIANDYSYGVAADASGNVYVAGSFEDVANFGGLSLTPLGASDAFVAKYSASGALQWVKGMGGISSDLARGIGFGAGTPVATGYFYGSGSFNGATLTSAGGADAFVVRLQP